LNNELPGKPQKKKNKSLLQQYFMFHAFHPKAVNISLYLAGLLASRFFELPSHSIL
jgi:hypothetical protein